MKEPNWKTCSEKELWEYVATHLSKNGIDTVLVGGAVVAIYTDGIYRSGDLDLVQLTYLTKNLPKVMKEIGFVVRESRHYSQPPSFSQCEYIPLLQLAHLPHEVMHEIRTRSPTLKVETLEPTLSITPKQSNMLATGASAANARFGELK